MRQWFIYILVILAVAVAVYVALHTPPSKPQGLYLPKLGYGGFSIEVTAYGNGSNIPESYGCSGANFSNSPRVLLLNKPRGTVSLVLVMVDINASMFIHWLLINIPPNVNQIPPGLPHVESTPYGIQLVNDFGNIGFNGPCPPSRHMYIIVVYALNSTIVVNTIRLTYSDLVNLVKGHVISSSIWVGYYG